jgi:hypothetical protein
MRLLENLRKRKRAVAAVVLPLIATVWFSASASACLGMAVDSHDRALADAAPPPHDHSEAHGHAGAHAGQAHSEDGALHARGTSHSHGACPHCPVFSGGSSSDSAATHVVCALLDDVSDSGAQTSAQKTELEHFALAQPIYVSPLELQSSAHLFSPIVAPVYRSVALNLRHCVFLI